MHYLWMLRLLDVRAAFEQRGWPAIDAEVVFTVDDPIFPDNAGPWKLRVERGHASVAPHTGAHSAPMSIGALSSMFSGYLRAGDAVRIGVLEADDPIVDAFTQLFRGPDPWCPFFF